MTYTQRKLRKRKVELVKDFTERKDSEDDVSEESKELKATSNVIQSPLNSQKGKNGFKIDYASINLAEKKNISSDPSSQIKLTVDSMNKDIKLPDKSSPKQVVKKEIKTKYEGQNKTEGSGLNMVIDSINGQNYKTETLKSLKNKQFKKRKNMIRASSSDIKSTALGSTYFGSIPLTREEPSNLEYSSKFRNTFRVEKNKGNHSLLGSAMTSMYSFKSKNNKQVDRFQSQYASPFMTGRIFNQHSKMN